MASIAERVFDVLRDWCGEFPSSTTELLINLWERTRNNASRPHTSVDFQPDAVNNLIAKLKSEFSQPPRRDLSWMSTSDFDPNGSIKSAADLIGAVGSSAEVEVAAFAAAGVALEAPASLDPRTLRLHAVLRDWCGDIPGHGYEPLIELWERTRAHPSQPHARIPLRGKGASRLLKALRKEYGAQTISFHEDDIGPGGSIEDTYDLLRRLHGLAEPVKVPGKRSKRKRK